jgi:hypothetical protein
MAFFAWMNLETPHRPAWGTLRFVSIRPVVPKKLTESCLRADTGIGRIVQSADFSGQAK